MEHREQCLQVGETAGSRTTIYIVEDDEAVRISLQSVLEIYGYSVHAFADGEEFLAQAQAGPSDCVILDVNLPGASGLRILEHLRTGGVPVSAIVVSGRATAQMRAEAGRLAALAFFEKPIDIDTLVATIESIGGL